ncbi:MAG: hypothetical protein WCV91_07105, partial [Candidatus Margulisiibacteriota bacterium]
MVKSIAVLKKLALLLLIFLCGSGVARSTPRTTFEATLNMPQVLINFSSEVSSYDLKSDNTIIICAYSFSKEVFAVYSENDGISFSSPILLSKNGRHPSIALKSGNVTISWEEAIPNHINNKHEKAIAYLKSSDGGKNYSATEIIVYTGEALTAPNSLIDNNNNIHFFFLKNNPNTKENSLQHYFEPLKKINPIYSSLSEISGLRTVLSEDNLKLFWESSYSGKFDPFCAVSFDNGASFSNPMEVRPGNKAKLLPPEIKSPPYGMTLYSTSQEIKCIKRPEDHLLITAAVSSDKDFPADKTINFYKISSNNLSETIIPVAFSSRECDFYIRLSADNGLEHSGYSNPFLYKIRPPKSEFTLNKPKANDWFKPGASIYIEASFEGSADSISDEAEALLSINLSKLTD